MTRMFHPRFTVLALCTVAMGLGACQTQSDSGTASNACSTFASRVCSAAGEESASCSSVKDTTAVLSDAACSAALKDVDATLAKIQAQRAPCNELVKKLCADLGAETDTCKMVTEKTPMFPVEQCTAMLGQYDAVLSDLRRREAVNAPLDAEKQAKLAAGPAPSFGPEDAKVTLVEFSDFQCPYCSRAAKTTQDIKAKYANKVRFVFRQFPLEMHPQAHLAAQASLAANAQGKFWEFHDKMFENQHALERKHLEQYAQDVGLDVAKFKQALEQETYKGTVDADLALGMSVAVQGTPTLFVNGKRVDNPTDTPSVERAIETALAAM